MNSIKNQAVNFPIQSLASDTCLDALIRLNNLLPQMGLGRVLFTVHDSIVFEIPEDRIMEAAQVVEQAMITPSYQTHVKYAVDIEVGYNLGEVKSLKEWTA